jgi:hypothetical protein
MKKPMHPFKSISIGFICGTFVCAATWLWAMQYAPVEGQKLERIVLEGVYKSTNPGSTRDTITSVNDVPIHCSLGFYSLQNHCAAGYHSGRHVQLERTKLPTYYGIQTTTVKVFVDGKLFFDRGSDEKIRSDWLWATFWQGSFYYGYLVWVIFSGGLHIFFGLRGK